MMNLFVGLALQMLTLPSFAHSLSDRPTQCSRDINEWGRPTICTCVKGQEYKPIGFCFKKESWHPKNVSLEGTLKLRIFGPGGETTGVGILINNHLTDLILRVSDRLLLKEYNRHTIHVDGKEVVLPSREPHGPRGWVAVIVEKVEILD